MKDQDKTKQQLIEELAELRHSEAKWRSVAENAPLLVIIVDAEGKIEFLNRCPPGFSLENVLGRPFYGFLEPQYHAVARECVGHVFRTGQRTSCECRVAGPDGSRTDYFTDVGPVIVDGEIIAATLIAKDITDRKRSEKALLESEERYRSFVRDFPGIAYRGRMDFSPIFFHGAVEAITGYSEEEFTSGRRRWDQAIHPDDFARLQESVEMVRSVRGYSTEREYRIVRDDGQIRWVHEIIHNTCDGSDKPAFVQGVVYDITRRKQAEEKLRESEARFRSLFQDASVGTVVVSPTGEFIQVNRAFCEFLGYSEQELVGKAILSVTHPDDREASSKAIHQAAHSGPHIQRLEKRYLHKGEGVVWGEVSSNLICDADGMPDHFVTQVLNVTERKRAEEELAKSRAMLQATVECLPFDFFAIGEDGHYLLENAVCRAHWGRLVGKTPEELAPAEAVRALWLDNNRRAFAGEKVEDVVSVTVQGEERFVYSVITPIQDESHSYGILGVNIDITARKRAEEALKKARSELEEKVRERTAELTKANEQLKREIEERKQVQEALRRSHDEFQAIYDNMVDGLLIGDCATGRFLRTNPAMCRMLGYSTDELLSMSVTGIHPAEVVPNVLEKFRTQQDGQRRITQSRPMLRKDGTVFHADISNVCTSYQGRPCIIGIFRDITERQRAEEALRQSKEQYELVERGAGVGIVDWNIPAGKVYYSPRWKTLFGYGEDDIGDGVEDWSSRLHPEERDSIIKRQDDFFAGTSPTAVAEYRLRHKDGSYRWVEANVLVVRDERGRACRLVGSHADITERKNAQEALRKSEESLRQSERRFRNYFEQGLIGMAATSLDGHWLEVNDHICEILGYEREELLRRTWKELTYPEDLGKDLELFNRLLAGKIEHYRLDKRFLRKDGSIVYTTIVIRAFRRGDGSIDHIVALMVDITARKQAEQALHQSHDELRSIYDGMGDGLLVADIETKKFVRCNVSMRQMLGYSEDELLSRSVLDIHPPDEVPSVLEKFRALVDGSQAVVPGIPVLRKDGSVFYADISHNEFTYNGRNCMAGFFRDITERKQAQEALERERQSLWKMLQASDYERQLISYEIHDGLAQYLAAAEMQFQAHDALREHLPHKARKAYETAMELLRQAHFEARRLISEVRPPVIDESGLETAISHLVHEQRRHGGPKIEYHSSVLFRRLPQILENSLYRIAQEALANACNHSKSKEVKVLLAQKGQEVRLEVQDWGIGFDLPSVGEGHFGLEGIRQRVRLLGGRLKIESTPGSGALVQVVVPIVEKKSEE